MQILDNSRPEVNVSYKTMDVAICCGDLDYQPLGAHISMAHDSLAVQCTEYRGAESEQAIEIINILICIAKLLIDRFYLWFYCFV